MRVTGFGVLYDFDEIPAGDKRISPDGTRAAAFWVSRRSEDRYDDDTVYAIAVWDIATKKQVESYTHIHAVNHQSGESDGEPLRDLEFDPSGKLLLVFASGATQLAEPEIDPVPPWERRRMAASSAGSEIVHPEMQDQAVLAEGCPHCKVLYPGLSPCPVCRGVPRHQPAQMMDEDGIRRAVHKTAGAYDGSRDSFDALTQLLFLYSPVSLDALEEHGEVSLTRLRGDDANQVGRSEAEVLARLGAPAARKADTWEYPDKGPANHFRRVVVLRFHDGRVIAQLERQVPEPCEPLDPMG